MSQPAARPPRACLRVCPGRNPLAQMEEEKKEHEAKMQRMEKEMEQVFEMKVREKMHKLKESEADVSCPCRLVSLSIDLRSLKRARNHFLQ